MPRLFSLMAVTGLTASAACMGCMPGVTYRVPMPNSLVLGTMKGEDGVGMASADQRASADRHAPATRPAAGADPRSADATMTSVSVAKR